MKLYILGNGEYANELFDQIILKNNKYNFQGFIIMKDGKAFVISEIGITPFSYHEDASFILGTQDMLLRDIFIEHFSKHYSVDKYHFPNIYSVNAQVSSTSIIGVGNIFLAFSCVTGIANIGNFNSFNTHSSLHSSGISNYNILYPYAGIMGKCTIGSYNLFHPNCIVNEKVNIGDDNIISSGECVFDDINNKELFQSGIILKKPRE